VRKVNSLTGRGFNSTPPPPHTGNKMAKAKKQFKRVKSTGGQGMQTRARKTKDPYPTSARGGKARKG